MAAIGVVLRDSCGHFIAAKAMNLGVASNITIGLTVVREGLHLLIELHYTHVIISNDSTIYVGFCNHKEAALLGHRRLVKDIK